MIARVYHRLPGPPAVRILLCAVLVLATLALLVLFSEWLESPVFDTGGQIL